MHLTYPMILMNGVMLYDPVSKSCINAEIIERDSVEYILKGRKKFGVTGFAYEMCIRDRHIIISLRKNWEPDS